MMQALSAQVIRHRRIMSDRCVFIVSSICDGYFHDERWPTCGSCTTCSSTTT